MLSKINVSELQIFLWHFLWEITFEIDEKAVEKMRKEPSFMWKEV